MTNILIPTQCFSNGYIMVYRHKEQEDPIIIDFLNNTTPGMNFSGV